MGNVFIAKAHVSNAEQENNLPDRKHFEIKFNLHL